MKIAWCFLLLMKYVISRTWSSFFLYVRKLVVWNKCQRGSLNSVSICNYDSANFFLLSRWVHCSLFLCKLLQIVSFNALLSTGTKKLISISALCMEIMADILFTLLLAISFDKIVVRVQRFTRFSEEQMARWKSVLH